ncbi:MAG: phosphoribosyltransferase family protein [Oligosphaeraceae bacterium]
MDSWPLTHTIHLGPDCSPELPLVDIGNRFRIYSFDLTGETRWNAAAADSLAQKLNPFDFAAILTVQTKSCGLAQALATRLHMDHFLEVRKSRKPLMQDPVGVTVNSITTTHQQELWLGREKFTPFIGQRICFLDDVVSTGGTAHAVLELAHKIGIDIAVIACVLTEGTRWTEFQGIPVVSLDHIPLPGTSTQP